jgi:hypothetical protein
MPATTTRLVVAQVGETHCPGSWHCCLEDAPDFHASGATIAEAVGALACKYPLALGLDILPRPWPKREGAARAEAVVHVIPTLQAAEAGPTNGHAGPTEADPR